MAEVIYRELNRLNRNMYNNTDRFFKHTIPFSFNLLLEDGNIEEFKKYEEYIEYYKDVLDDKIIKMIIKDLDTEEKEQSNMKNSEKEW